MTQTVELPIYEKNGKQYCEDCKPSKNAQRGTLVVSGYDHFCAGCGEDFKVLGWRKQGLIIDQEIRFAERQQVEISTETGWTPATVEKIISWPEGFAYKVSYIPSWSKVTGYTVVTGLAVRKLA